MNEVVYLGSMFSRDGRYDMDLEKWAAREVEWDLVWKVAFGAPFSVTTPLGIQREARLA